MPTILLRKLEPTIFNVIADKQKQLQQEKQRIVSLEQTVYVLLKDAYLRDKEKVNGIL